MSLQLDGTIGVIGPVNEGSVTATGTTTPRNLETRFADVVNVKDFGAVGDGVADDTAAIQAAASYAYSNGKTLLIPKGNYFYSSSYYELDSDRIIHKGSFTGGINPLASAENINTLITTVTKATSPLDPKETRVALSVTAVGRGSNHADGIRSNIVNYSDDGDGNTAFYGEATSVNGAYWSAAVHGETRHGGGTSIALSSENVCYNANGSMYGLVVSQTTAGAPATHPIDGSTKAIITNGTGIQIMGTGDIDGDIGTWTTAFRITKGATRPSGKAISIESSAQTAIQTAPSTSNSVSDIFLQGNSNIGIILNGNYTSGVAIRLVANNAIAFEATGSIKQYYDSQWINFSSSSNIRARINTSTNVAEFGQVRPFSGESNVYPLGGASHKWTEVFATNGTINTSDAREKQQIRTISDKEKSVATKLKSLIRAYKWNDAVESKGDGARIHFGVIAQDVKTAFEEEGLNADEYGIFCYDEWDATEETKAGNSYGVRYNELFAFILSAI